MRQFFVSRFFSGEEMLFIFRVRKKENAETVTGRVDDETRLTIWIEKPMRQEDDNTFGHDRVRVRN